MESLAIPLRRTHSRIGAMGGIWGLIPSCRYFPYLALSPTKTVILAVFSVR